VGGSDRRGTEWLAPAGFDNRSGCAAVPQRGGQGGRALSHGPFDDRELNGLIVDARLTEANGTAERATALDMIDDNGKAGSTVGADKNYDQSPIGN
jgi:hypothetical protein